MAESKSKDQREQEQLDKVDELRRMQKAGKVPMITANRDKNFKIPKTEEGYVHCLLTTKNVGADMKSLVEQTKTDAYHADRFDVLVEQGAFQAFDDVKIIHDPRDGYENKVYSFKPEKIEAAAVTGARATGIVKANEMKAINQARKEIGDAQDDLATRTQAVAEKEKELTDKEAKIKSLVDEQGAKLEEKEKTLEEREAALNAREAALAAKETPKDETPNPKENK
jgi:hypothetical protein